MITRRKFTGISTLAGIGTVAGCTAPVPKTGLKSVSANDIINVGLIGCRSMGGSNLRDFIRNQDVECIALCDVDQDVLDERVKDVFEKTGKKPLVFKDYRKLLDLKEVDVVIIATPDHWHCLPFVDACKAGKDIYVEKPLANSIAECNIMLRAAKKYNRIATVGQQQRSGAEWAKIMGLVKSGTLGDVKRINCWANFDYGAGEPRVPDSAPPQSIDYDQWLGPAPFRPFNKNRVHGLWRMNWDYGGGLMTDWGVHLLDMALWAMGDTRQFPGTVVASGGIMRFPGNEIQTPDTLNVVFNYGDWVLSWEHSGGIQTGPWNRNYGVSFVGSKGTIVADRASWEMIPEGKNDKVLAEGIPLQTNKQNEHQAHVRHFLDAVKNRKQPDCTIETGHAAAVTALLGNLAYRTGEILRYDPQKQGFMDSSKANGMMAPVYRSPLVFPLLD
ncbi:MAG: Gfo/Idh/MocA family oxidoreductase [Prolixibacteraceae bacterium]|jgi:predicted dehydrogenase|nr:Gfo/Idh/MocA family oxidoreductase [Prolixibacteraceae bacterium]